MTTTSCARGVLTKLRSSGLSSTAGSQILVTSVSLLSSPLLARTVGAAGRGDVAAVLTTITLLSWVCFLGLPQSCGFYSSRYIGRNSIEMAVLATTLGALAAVVVWVAAPAFASVHGDTVVTALRVGGFLLPFIGLGQCGQEVLYARGSMRMWNAIRSIPVAGGSVAVIILFSKGQLSTASALAANLGALACWALVGSSVVVAQIWNRSNDAFRRSRDIGRNDSLRYAGQAWLAAASLALFGRLDQLMMVPYGEVAELGRYAVAVTVVGAANVLPSAIGIVAYPAVRSVSGTELLSTLRKSRRRLLVLGIATNAAVVLAAPSLLQAVFGADFGGLFLVVLLLAVGQLLNDLWLLRVSVLNGTGRPSAAITPSWISTGVCVVLLVLFSRGGITAVDAALATAASAAIRPLVARAVSGPFDRLLGSS